LNLLTSSLSGTTLGSDSRNLGQPEITNVESRHEIRDSEVSFGWAGFIDGGVATFLFGSPIQYLGTVCEYRFEFSEYSADVRISYMNTVLECRGVLTLETVFTVNFTVRLTSGV